MIKMFKILTAVLLIASSAISQDTFFSYGFEYEGVPPEGFDLLELSELSDSDGELVGEWAGDDFQFPDPTGFFSLNDASAGIVDNPHGGTMLYIDRPVAPAVHEMVLTEPILLPGASFSVTVGTRRTGGGFPREPKSYDFFGLDDQGNESFRIRILADASQERLGYVVDDQIFNDFDTVVGQDMSQDIQNIGGTPFALTADIVELNVRLGATGYVVEYSNLNGENAWTSASVPFNKTGAQNLAKVALSYGGVEAVNNDQVGFVVDDVSVTGFTELLLGDFDLDGNIDMADFLVLSGNFGKNTSDGDFDFNGTVDLSDWVGFKAAYNAANAAGRVASVPEPSSQGLILAGLLAGLGWRRKRS